MAELFESDQQVLRAWLVEFEKNWSPSRLDESLAELPAHGPLRAATLLAMARIDLDRRWKSGQQLLVEEYLDKYPELAANPESPLELAKEEFAARRAFGTPISAEQMAQRFPDHSGRFLAWTLGEEHHTTPGASRPSAGTARVGPQGDVTVLIPPGAYTGHEIPNPFGRYQIVKRLGRGGMGTVYLALDTQLDREVALKVPHFADVEETNLPARFLREAKIAAKLQHANICALFDYGNIGPIYFLTMPHISGPTLSHKVKKGARVPPREAALLVQKLANALAYAHGRGVIHRDLKLSNVMLSPEGEPIIMDFGLARNTDAQSARITHSGDAVGTPAYMAPEQLQGKLEIVGPRSDIYSLGVMFFELLTGHLPFEGPVLEIVHKLATEPAPPLSTHGNFDPALEAICEAALAKDPADRIPTMNDFAAALDRYLKDVPAPAATQTYADVAALSQLRTSTAGPRQSRPPSASPTSWKAGQTPPSSSTSRGWLVPALLLLGALGGVGIWLAGPLLWPQPVPEPVPPKSRTVLLRTDPPGAQVYFNDRKQATPSGSALTPPDFPYRLKLELEGFASLEETIRGESDESKVFALTPLPVARTRRLRLQSIPPGATVHIDGQVQPTRTDGDFDVPLEPFLLRLEIQGGAPYEAKIAPGEVRDGALSPITLLARVQVTSEPAGAEVRIDDKAVGKKTPCQLDLAPGNHRLELRHEDYKPTTSPVTVEQPGGAKPQMFALRLVPRPPPPVVVRIESNPPGARVLINGALQTRRTNDAFEVPPPPFVLRLESAGMTTVEKKVLPADIVKGALPPFTLTPLSESLFGVFVGVHVYDHGPPPFLHARSDVKRLQRLLLAAGIPASQLITLTRNRAKDDPTVYPDGRHVRDSITAQSAKAGPGDVLLVALSGHVVKQDGGVYFCPADARLDDRATLIALADVLAALTKSAARQKVLVLDGWRAHFGPREGLGLWTRDFAALELPANDVTVLLSCGPSQKSFPLNRANEFDSVFYRCLADGLLGDADADGNSDVTGQELAAFLQRSVPTMAANEFPGSEQTPEAVHASQSRIVRVTPGLALFRQACAELERRNHAEAIALLDQAEKLLPDFADLYLKRAEAKYFAKDWRAAEQDCLKALALDDTLVFALTTLTDLSLDEGRFRDALRFNGQALELDPANPFVHLDRAHVALRSDDYGGCVKHATTALELNPRLPIGYHFRAQAHLNLKTPQKAVDDYTLATKIPGLSRGALLSLFKGRAEAQREVARSKSISKDDQRAALDGAVSDYTRVLDADATDGQSYSGRGVAYTLLKDYKKAASDFRKAVDLSPQNKVAWLNLGVTHINLKDAAAAKEALQRAVELDAKFAQAHFYLGRAYELAGDKTKASFHTKKAKDLGFP